MLHKNIIKLAALLWCVLTVASCTNEDFGKGDNGSSVREGLPVTATLNIGTPEVPVVETKSLENNGKFGVINNLAIIDYDKDGQNPQVTFVPSYTSGSVEFQTKTGTRKIYVLTNVGSASVAQNYAGSKETDLLAQKIQAVATPFGEEMMLGFVSDKNMATSGSMYDAKAHPGLEITEDKSFYAQVVPPYSKITFKITKNLPDMDQVYLNIHNVKIRRLPQYYTLTSLSGKGDDKLGNESISDTEIDVNIDDVQSAAGYSFYMYENKQGEYPNSRGPEYKSPGITVPESAEGINYGQWFSKWDILPYTYIEVEGKYSIVTGKNTVEAGDIHYRFFLGEDAISNFNICRNTKYVVTLDFSKSAGYGELKHEWRVYAKLDEATFIPEGDLLIDGYQQGIGYVPFYVANATVGSVTLTTINASTADMMMYFDQSGTWGSSSAADFKEFAVPANSMKEFAIAPNDVGILGAGRDYDQGSYNKYSDNLTYRDQIAKGEIYNTRVYQITFKTDVETKTSKLIVKELPLLLLTDSYNPDSRSTTYARRVDGAYLSSSTVEGSYDWVPRNEYFTRTTDKVRAQRICTNHPTAYTDPYSAASVGNYLKSFLPTRNEIDKIIQLEKANPLKDAKYWTMDGLYDVVTKQIVSDGGEGYIRCVARGVNK